MSIHIVGNGVPPCPQFDLGLLRKQITNRSWAPESGHKVAAIDTGLNDGPRCDFTALVAGTIADPVQAGPQPLAEPSRLWITHITFDRFAATALPKEIAEFYERLVPDGRVVGELINGIQFLQILVRQEMKLRGLRTKETWLPASRAKDAKVLRIRKLINLHLEDRLRLVAADWNGEFLEEVERWDGSVKNRGRRDDLIDASSLLVSHFMR